MTAIGIEELGRAGYGRQPMACLIWLWPFMVKFGQNMSLPLFI